MATGSNTKEESTFPINTFIILAFLVVVLWVVYGVVVTNLNLKDWAERGLFGDMFGGLNALFSGLAFAGLICAIWMQRTEIQLQRNDLKLQREIMEAQVEEARQLAHHVSVQAQIMEKNYEIEHEPLFVCGEPNVRPRVIEIFVHNLGGKTVNLSTKEVSEEFEIIISPNTFVEKNGVATITIKHYQEAKIDEKISFIFCYHNIFGEPSEFQCHFDNKNFQRENFFSEKLVHKGTSSLAQFFDGDKEDSK